MKKLVLLVVYTALSLGANIAAADSGAAEALRTGSMKKLNFHSAPQTVTETGFQTVDGAPLVLADYRGKIALVNFWATWCAPCRKEMPMLAELQTELSGDDFEVVTIATGRNPPPSMRRFFDEIGVENLPLHRDPKQTLARAMGVFGLPITVILDRDGQEIARLQGDADWASDSAKAVLRALIEAPGG